MQKKKKKKKSSYKSAKGKETRDIRFMRNLKNFCTQSQSNPEVTWAVLFFHVNTSLRLAPPSWLVLRGNV